VLNGYLLVIVTLALFLILDLAIPYGHVFAQVNQTKENAILTPTNNMLNAGTPPNSTGIMQNTSGIIDDAIDAIKNSLNSFFKK
jgi:hypothetical protein